MTRFPDNPKLVSIEFLKTLDRDPPGTWLAQPKLDGYRRTAYKSGWKWSYQAKHTTGPAAKAMPPDLVAEFESLRWGDGVGLDMEWVGPRQAAGGLHSLHVFDILAHGQSGWLGDSPFKDRYMLLEMLWQPSDRVKIVPIFKNPGLLDRFAEQTTNPLSEGLVIRKADSKLIGSTRACATNSFWFKVKFARTKEMSV